MEYETYYTDDIDLCAIIVKHPLLSIKSAFLLSMRSFASFRNYGFFGLLWPLFWSQLGVGFLTLHGKLP